MMDRRNFLRALAATAIAVQLPNLPKAEAAQLADDVAEQLIKIRVNGKPPNRVAITQAANGWHHVAAYFEKGSAEYDLDFTSMNDGKGLYIGPVGPHYEYGAQFDLGGPTDDCMVSIYVKPARAA